jgi:hypothetical protein
MSSSSSSSSLIGSWLHTPVIPSSRLLARPARTSPLELGELGEDRVSVLLGTRLSAEVARDGLALGDGLSGQHGETRLRHGSTSALPPLLPPSPSLPGHGLGTRCTPKIRLTVRAAFSILSANSFRPMCLFHHKHRVPHPHRPITPGATSPPNPLTGASSANSEAGQWDWRAPFLRCQEPSRGRPRRSRRPCRCCRRG